MSENRCVLLLDRDIITIQGDDAKHFLQSLITTDIERINENEVHAGALLTPQGKVAFDFVIGKSAPELNGYFIDVNASLAPALEKRLLLFKLRAKVAIQRNPQKAVTVSWASQNRPANGSFRDRRFPESANVWRFYGKATDATPNRDHWNLLRIAHGVAESGQDFSLLEQFAHDINLDQIGGLSFSKGCYMGQEVVSRMHHRKSARRRLMIGRAASDLPAPFTPIEADGTPLGLLGSSVGGLGLAIVRIDRVKVAIDKGQLITCAAVPLQLEIPPEANFTFPSGEEI